MIQNKLVAFLRGVNVGGKRLVKMADLKTLHEGLGHLDVKTYLQTGNIIFKTNQSIELFDLAKQLEIEYEKKFELDIKVIIKTWDEIIFADKSNPIPLNSDIDDKMLHIVFLSEIPESDQIKTFMKYEGPEVKKLINDILYIYYVEGVGRSKLTLSFIEKKLNVTGTARNLNTLKALVNLCRED